MIGGMDDERTQHLLESHPLANAGRRERSTRMPRLRLSERKLLLLSVDLLLINGALVASLQLRADYPTTLEFYSVMSKWFVSLTILWMAVSIFFDVYSLPRASSVRDSVASAGGAALTTVVLYTFVPVVTPPLQARGQLFTFWMFAVVGVVTWRFFYARFFGQPWYMQRALLVGAGPAGRELVMTLRTRVETPNPFKASGYQVVCFVDPNPENTGRTVYGVPVLGDHSELVELAQRLGVDEVVLELQGQTSDEMVDAVLRCGEMGLRVCSLPDLYERILGRVPVLLIGNNLASVLDMRENAGERLLFFVKRFVDLVAGIFGLALVLVMAPLIWFANLVSGTPGPIFYGQQRVGRGGALFDVAKFRTMIPDAELETGAVWSSQDDPRVTPMGRWLRRTRLDELPQCLNIIRGEMSLIGPRPERPEFVNELIEQIPYYRARHAVRPGLTGWAQVHYEYGNSVDDARIKLEYDLYYIKHLDFFLDLRILVRTLAVVLQMKGM